MELVAMGMKINLKWLCLCLL